jgi:hypothetical protein
MERRHAVAAGLFALGAGLLWAGCTPAEGKECSGSAGACVDGKTAMLCIDGKFTKVPCRGSIGCMKPGLPIGTGDVTCAHDEAEEGEACEDNDAATCSGDKKQMLKCVDHEWSVEMECSGVHGCVASAKEVKCTGGVDKEGDECKEDGFYSCTPDKSKILVCKDKKMTVASLCKGQHGCRLQGKKVDCDSSLSDEGDPCMEGTSACTMDKKALLACKDGKYQKERDCKQCTVFLDKIECK